MELQQPIAIVLCTVTHKRNAVALAKAFINQGCAACVNIIEDVTSVYRWDDNVVEDIECQLVIKTAMSHVDDAYQLMLSMHPYDVPEWVVINADASEPYLDWMKSNLK
ncbi:MAG: divalent-cation tolerance protein CutA [Alteromonas sp.]